MIRQERIAVRRTLWEFPAGQIDVSYSPTISQVRSAARRELQEESGWHLAKGGQLHSLGMFFTSPGFTSEHAWLFVADPVEPHPNGSTHDSGEAIVETKLFSKAEMLRMIAGDEIQDANTLCSFARLLAHGWLNR
jgi:8-oxo-dGTP pyrophosphatase MutT (NUDIX family)